MNDARYMHEIEGLEDDVSLFGTINGISGYFDDMTAEELRVLSESYYIHSSRKRLSPLCRRWVNKSPDLASFISLVSASLVSRFGANWKSIYDAYFLESYNPLENYSMEEKETPDLVDTTDINTRTELKNSSKTKVYGFNSETAVNDGETEVETTGDKDKNETTSKTTRKGTRTLTRSGNIGVTTSQQMLQSELDLRKYDFWEMVFCDIDRLLCFMMESV